MSGNLVPVGGSEICNNRIFSKLATPELRGILVSGLQSSLPASHKKSMKALALRGPVMRCLNKTNEERARSQMKIERTSEELDNRRRLG
jgi:hypothetical protein